MVIGSNRKAWSAPSINRLDISQTLSGQVETCNENFVVNRDGQLVPDPSDPNGGAGAEICFPNQS